MLLTFAPNFLKIMYTIMFPCANCYITVCNFVKVKTVKRKKHF